MAHFSKYKKKDGTVVHRVRVVIGYELDGTPIQESRSYTTATEAKQAAKAWETQIAQGASGANAKSRLSEYLEEWLTRKARTARPITVESYRWIIKRQINDTTLAKTTLGKLTPAAVEKWIDGMAPPATARMARAVLNIALNEATRLGYIPFNPVSRTTAPAHFPRQGQAWTVEEVQHFLAVADNDVYAPYWHLACYLGLRPSEITGLHWSSVDLAAGTVTIEYTRPTAGGKTFATANTKSPSGKRTLALAPQLIARLRRHQHEQPQRRDKHDEHWQETGFICVSEFGTPLEHRNVQRRFHHLRQAAGLRRIRLYDLRHTATSLMIDAGADLKAASEALGHSDPRITMNVYRHVRGDQRAKAMHLLADAIDVPMPEKPADSQ